MKFWRDIDLTEKNEALTKATPQEIVSWALKQSSKVVVTTNFRPYEGAILHLTNWLKPDIKVIWCDTGYNTPQTYQCAENLIDQLSLNIQLYVPLQTAAHRDVTIGIPDVNAPEHKIFTQQVKLEPFNRAFKEHQPEIWFTNLRKGQTALRDELDILSVSKDGVLKVSPFYHYSDEMLEVYMQEFNLPNEHNYFDPTKALANRECGLHT